MGDSCLIISDNNSTPTYTADKTNTSVAYVEFTHPAGDYDLSFAWRCVGESGKDGLYVC